MCFALDQMLCFVAHSAVIMHSRLIVEQGAVRLLVCLKLAISPKDGRRERLEPKPDFKAEGLLAEPPSKDLARCMRKLPSPAEQ